MPSALYAISYDQSGLVLSFCELAKRDLSKAGAVQAMLDEILGDQLQISLSFLFPPATSPVDPIKIDKALLSVDEVNLDPKDIPKITDWMKGFTDGIVADPTRFRLDLPLLDLRDATAKAGDGTVKKLLDPTLFQLATVKLQQGVAPTNGLQVTFPTTFASGTKLYAIIDGRPQPPFVAPQPPAPVLFPYTTGNGTWHTVVFATRSYTPFFGVMQAQP